MVDYIMDHTLDNINGFKIQQRGVGHRWMHFLATRERDGACKSHHDLGTIKAWAKAQPSLEGAQPPVGSILQEIADKGFTQWALGSSYDEHREESSSQAHWRATFAVTRPNGLTEKE